MTTHEATDTSLHPLVALSAIQRLIGSPDDTRQVFVVLRAMRGKSGVRSFQRFKASPVGAQVLRERRCLLDALNDRAALAQLPQGTLGRAYFDFMTMENLSAHGLIETGRSVETDEIPEEEQIFLDRMRVLHDVAHVVTGYGREPLGELCLLAFNFGQSGHLGMGLIVLMAILKSRRGPQARTVRACVFEGWRRGRRAGWLAGQDWETLLREPLAAVRGRLGIAGPGRYVGVPA